MKSHRESIATSDSPAATTPRLSQRDQRYSPRDATPAPDATLVSAEERRNAAHLAQLTIHDTNMTRLALPILFVLACYRAHEPSLSDAGPGDAEATDANGSLDPLDGELATAPCAPTTELCDGADSDCDGFIDERSCSAGLVCRERVCACASTCDGECTDLTMDGRNCGSCGATCAAGQGCVAGECCELASTPLDILFVVNEHRPRGRLMDEAIPEFVRALVTGDHDGDGVIDAPATPDLHIGVVTDDMGTGGVDAWDCGSTYGDDGEFGRGPVLPRPHDTCVPSAGPPYLEYAGGDAEDLARRAVCVATSHRATECSWYVQPLEAMLKALTPATSDVRFTNETRGHGDSRHAGFLRPDSLLLVVLFADTDDCSTGDPAIFDATLDLSPGGTRCLTYRERLHDLDRYVHGLTALRPVERLHVAVVGGLPSDRAGRSPDFAAILTDPAMETRPTDGDPPQLRHFCSVAGLPAAPTPRLVEFTRRLAARGVSCSLGSLCDPSLDGSFADIRDAISNRLRRACR